MRILAKVLLFAFLATVGMGLVLLLVLTQGVNLNAARTRLCASVTETTGRSCVIEGDMTLFLRAGDGADRRWLPHLLLRLDGLRFGNPAWAASGPVMASVARADVRVPLPPLLRGDFELTPQTLIDPRLVLERGPDGQDNWHIRKRPNVHWNLRELDMAAGTLRYTDAASRTDLVLQFARSQRQGSVDWNLDGRLGKETVNGKGLIGKMPSLANLDASYPIKAVLTAGKTLMKLDGDVTDPFREPRLDLRLGLVGATLAQLFPFTGVALPETPRFSIEGRLRGTLSTAALHLRFEDFSGAIGGSDIAGTLDYQRQTPRPLLSGEVRSARLDWKDLAPLLGTDAPAQRKARGAEPRRRPDKVFPVEPFRIARWTRLDARVRLRVDRFVRLGQVPLTTGSAALTLKDGVFSLAPLRFGLAGGRVDADLRIDGNAAPPEAQLNIAAQRLRLHQLFPNVAAIQGSHSELGATARLTARGDSMASLFAAAQGEASAVVGQGSLSRSALDAIGLNLGGMLMGKLFGDSRVTLHCGVADFGIAHGVMQTRAFVIDTEDALVLVDGRIDLGRETIALEARPESKGISLMSLRAPLHIRGSFRHPTVEADKRIVSLKAGAAVALGLVASPLAALLPLMSAGSKESGACSGRLAAGKEGRAAPAEAGR